ncbi:MAG: RNB domain-containing ribonuclease, partial [Flavobacteriales bacterium]|nr:RNB domain-containing ribonuclease [Flavobacteriales bacterium]
MSKHKKNSNSGGFKANLIQQIISIFDKNPTQTFNYKQLSQAFGFKDVANKKLVNIILEELTHQGKLRELKRGSFKLNSSKSLLEGTLDMTSRGAAYLIVPDTEVDVYIAPKNTGNALHGDKVKVNVFYSKANKKPEGEVIEVVERAKTEFVGIVEKSKNFAFVVTSDQRMPVDIFIANDKLKGAKNGEKVVAKITEWPADKKNPFGIVTQVLGMPGEHDTEMHAILAEYGLPYEFPEKVEHDAAKLNIEIDVKEIKKRRDFRAITTFTIDPADAKDFDDALSIKKLENGNWEIGVHIADVSHYVRPGTLLDDEALKRATSVYLVDRVVPMLPEILSNNACSLRTQETKLCFSAVFELTENAELKNEWFGRTVIFSDRRFSYEEAQERIETKEGDLQEEINVLNGIAKKLRDKRYKNGAISFEREEMRFKLDDAGKPIDIVMKVSKDAHKLIEEFMLLANREVATHFKQKVTSKKNPPFVYRVHDQPDEAKLTGLQMMAARFGHNVDLHNVKDAS